MLTGCWLDVDWMLTGRWTATWAILMVDAMGYSASHTMILLARLRVCVALCEFECVWHCASFCVCAFEKRAPRGYRRWTKKSKAFEIITTAVSRPPQTSSNKTVDISIGWLAKSCISLKNHPLWNPTFNIEEQSGRVWVYGMIQY